MRRPTGLSRFHRHRLIAAALLALSAIWPGVAVAQTPWELSPYEIKTIVAVDPQIDPTGALQADVIEELDRQAATVVGAVWEFAAQAANGPLARNLLDDPALDLEHMVSPEQLAGDKLMTVVVRIVEDRLEVAARDFDCRTRITRPAVTRIVQQRQELPAEAFRAVLEAFMPVAEVVEVEDGRAELRMKAAALASPESDLSLLSEGDIFQPVLRRVSRSGAPDDHNIIIAPWTWLTVDQSDNASLRYVIHSGTRQGLLTRRRGRTELVALAARPRPVPTRLELVASQSKSPLPGYEVFVEGGESNSPQRVGVTDQQGRLTLPAGEGPLLHVYIKSDARVIAKLPLVPGLQSTVTVELPSDAGRTAAESALAGLQDRLIDVVVRRQILINQIDRLIEQRELEEASQQFDELRRLPTRQQFGAWLIERHRQSAADSTTDATIAKRVDDTRQLLNVYLDPLSIDAVASRLEQARRDALGSARP
ncbi:MAG: hypothetical protein WDZ59_12910 [Pirellulales bacterium]